MTSLPKSARTPSMNIHRLTIALLTAALVAISAGYGYQRRTLANERAANVAQNQHQQDEIARYNATVAELTAKLALREKVIKDNATRLRNYESRYAKPLPSAPIYEAVRATQVQEPEVLKPAQPTSNSNVFTVDPTYHAVRIWTDGTVKPVNDRKIRRRPALKGTIPPGSNRR